MVRTLLIRGMLVGIVAGLLAFGFSRAFGEPQIDQAIAFEAATGQAKAHADMAAGKPMPEDEPELVSRPVQAGIGLFTGVAVYSTAFGGLFALVFACANGRIGRFGPRGVSALLAAAGIVAIYIVPSLKYPASPPAVGEPETIGLRTGLFFAMILISVAAMTGAAMLRERLAARHGDWPASLVVAAAYVGVVVVAMLVLPAIDEVPEHFPAVVLWRFRMASLGAQVVMWTTLGLAFGWLTERAAAGQRERAGRFAQARP